MTLKKKSKITICVVIGSRANYSSIKSVIDELNISKRFNLILILNTSALLERFGNVSQDIESDGFKVNYKIYNYLDGGNLVTMTKSAAIALQELPTILEKEKPEFVVTIGDRYETIATAIAASFMNIKLIHTMGGELSGTIDENIRHAITKLSHLHFVATLKSKQRLIRMGENPNRVFNVGCPRIDIVKKILSHKSKFKFSEIIDTGVGDFVDPAIDKFIMISFHPDTLEYNNTINQIMSLVNVLKEINCKKIFLWPNSDAGNEQIVKYVRTEREKGRLKDIRFFKNLSLATYINLMKKTSCLIGNSSSGIREGAFIGTPVVNIGNRQKMRERARNVIDVNFDKNKILKAIKFQMNKNYNSSKLYGDGNSSKKIINTILKSKNISISKNFYEK